MVFGPYRIATIPAPEAPDPADAYEAFLRMRARRLRRVGTAVLVALASAFALAMVETPAAHPNKLEVEDAIHEQVIQHTRATVETAQRAAASERTNVRAAIRAAVDRATMATGTTPCPTPLPLPTRLVHGQQAFPFAVVERDPATWTSPSADVLLADVQRAEDHLQAGRMFDATLYAHALASPGRLRHDVVLVADVYRPAVATDGRTFEPGVVSGRAYLYDFAERRVTCTGAVHATSSTALEYTYVEGANATLAPTPNLAASLRDDLEINVQRAIVAGLVSLDALDD